MALPSLTKLSTALKRIHDRWPNIVVKPQDRDREVLVQAMRQRLDHDDWSGATMSDVTSAAVALFDEERRARADLAALRQFYCAEVSCNNNASFLRSMFEVYVESYVPRAPHTIELARALSQSRNKIGGQWEKLITSFPECLDPNRAHAMLAERMVQMASPWNELRALGLRSPHAPGLMEYAHLRFVEHISPELHELVVMERLFGWLKPEGKQARVSGAAEAISALLAPWQIKAPSADVERYLTENLLLLYGDPRVRGENANWSGVPSHLRAIIERWLTGENIRFFLDVVSAVEKDLAQNHMWPPRKKFWLDLHKQKRIDAAWVAFSAAGVEHARTSAAENKFLRFGKQTAGGTREKTSLLVLKIGGKIVIEGSHTYKVYVFRDDHPKAPKLYEKNYDCEEIRHIPGSWSTSHNGDWQGRVLEKI